MDRGQQLVQVLSCVLSRLVAANDRNPAQQQRVTKFHALRPPTVSLRDYFERIYKYSSCSSECFVLALVYIDRLIQGNSVVLTSLNVHRIVITALMLAAKFFDDQYFNNAYFAKVGGVPCIEMNSLELEFLFSINFALHVPTDIYLKYNMELVNHIQIPTVACECPAIFRAHGVVLALPVIPPALPGPDDPIARTAIEGPLSSVSAAPLPPPGYGVPAEPARAGEGAGAGAGADVGAGAGAGAGVGVDPGAAVGAGGAAAGWPVGALPADSAGAADTEDVAMDA